MQQGMPRVGSTTANFQVEKLFLWGLGFLTNYNALLARLEGRVVEKGAM